jgi:hypothetical protein
VSVRAQGQLAPADSLKVRFPEPAGSAQYHRFGLGDERQSWNYWPVPHWPCLFLAVSTGEPVSGRQDSLKMGAKKRKKGKQTMKIQYE